MGRHRSDEESYHPHRSEHHHAADFRDGRSAAGSGLRERRFVQARPGAHRDRHVPPADGPGDRRYARGGYSGGAGVADAAGGRGHLSGGDRADRLLGLGRWLCGLVRGRRRGVAARGDSLRPAFADGFGHIGGRHAAAAAACEREPGRFPGDDRLRDVRRFRPERHRPERRRAGAIPRRHSIAQCHGERH